MEGRWWGRPLPSWLCAPGLWLAVEGQDVGMEGIPSALWTMPPAVPEHCPWSRPSLAQSPRPPF